MTALTLNVGVVVLLMHLIRKGARSPVPSLAARAELWSDPAFRAEQVRLAREHEAAKRQIQLAWQAAPRSSAGGNGKQPQPEPAGIGMG